jgi:hypothetical protein
MIKKRNLTFYGSIIGGNQCQYRRSISGVIAETKLVVATTKESNHQIF